MKTKFMKSILTGLTGAILSAISLYGMNPVGMAAYGAMEAGSLYVIPAVPIFLFAIYGIYGLMDTIKYGLAMFLISAFIVMMKQFGEEKKKLNSYIGGLACAVPYALMECADVFMTGGNRYRYFYALMSAVMVFCLTVIFAKLIEILLGEDRIRYEMRRKRKEEGKQQQQKIMEGYQEKLRLMADSFEKMSKSMSGFENRTSREPVLSGEVGIINEIWKNKLRDSRQAVAQQLREMSMILKDVTGSSYVFDNLKTEEEKKLRRQLRKKGIFLKSIVILNNRRGIGEVNLHMRGVKGAITIGEVGELVSKMLGKNLYFMQNGYAQVGREYRTYTYVEEPNFFVLHGAAKKTGSDQVVSGDHFTCMDLKTGQTLLSVSDGMGSGIQAEKESGAILELLEEMMQGGFREETAIRLINSIFMVDADVMNPAALDMGIIDMYSGVCDFLKLGASATFVKRGSWVEAIKSTSLPLGSSAKADIEMTSKKLYDGDFVIMISDGMLESICEEDKEKTISEIILGIREGKPEDMAKEILQKTLQHTDRRKEDDMTVLVTGIWDKCA